jgi:hypothetical protein
MNKRARKIVAARVKRWDGLCPGVPYGVAYEFDDGVEGGVAVGTKSEAQRLAGEAGTDNHATAEGAGDRGEQTKRIVGGDPVQEFTGIMAQTPEANRRDWRYISPMVRGTKRLTLLVIVFLLALCLSYWMN